MQYLKIDRTISTLSDHEDDRNTPVINEIKNLKAQLQQKEELIKRETEEIYTIKGRLDSLLRQNTETPIKWKFALNHCAEVDATKSMYFLKSSNSMYACIAKKYSIEITRDIKNKISTTLSIMHRAGELGRLSYNGTSYYGVPELFKKNDLTQLKPEYEKYLTDLTEIVA